MTTSLSDQSDARRSRIPVCQLPAVPDSLTGGAIAIGNFDGIHLGHRHLLELTREDARSRGIPAVVLTFEPHPRTVFRPDQPIFRLTDLDAKTRLLTAFGFDGLVVLPFDRSFAGRSAEAFVADILVGALAIDAITVGYDFHFGQNREGSPDYLRQAGVAHGFDVRIIDPVKVANQEPYSATRIRDALASGDIAGANRLLGYRWFVAGTVVTGDRRGRDLGYPTANIRLAPDCRLHHGIYAVRLTGEDNVTRDAVASYGRRPTFDDGPPLLEVHVFDYAGSLYGQTVVVSFVDWLRGEERFDSAEALVRQMDLDSQKARIALHEAGPGNWLDQAVPLVR